MDDTTHQVPQVMKNYGEECDLQGREGECPHSYSRDIKYFKTYGIEIQEEGEILCWDLIRNGSCPAIKETIWQIHR